MNTSKIPEGLPPPREAKAVPGTRNTMKQEICPASIQQLVADVLNSGDDDPHEIAEVNSPTPAQLPGFIPAKTEYVEEAVGTLDMAEDIAYV